MAIDFKTDIDGTAFNGITGLASTVSPVNGTAAVGTSTAVARQDHVHGTDTSRAPTVSPTFTGTVVLPSGQALIAPVIENYAVFKGETSGGTKLVATAVAGTTVLTLPAVTGTLATIGGEETLGGKTLSSPTFTGTVSGITKGMVALGRVDNTSDEDKPVSTFQQTALDLKVDTAVLMEEILPDAAVSTATKLATARTIGGVSFSGLADINLPGVNTAGNQSTTGNAATATKLATAVNIGGVPFDGSANIPQTQTTYHSASFTFAENTRQYIGLLRADSESTTVSNIFLPFLAPVNGKLLKVFVRSSNGLTGGQLKLRLEKNALGVPAGTTPPTTVATSTQLGPTNSAMTTYDFTSLVSPNSGSNTITAGDMIFISIESTAVFTAVKIYFTFLWEWDF
jgi:hypothetical protein